MLRAKSRRSSLSAIRSIAEKLGSSIPKATLKSGFGEPQYGAPTVSMRATFFDRASSST